MVDEALNVARELADPQSMTFTLFVGNLVHQLRGEGRQVQDRSGVQVELASEQGYTFFRVTGTILHGWALADQGDLEKGVEQLRQGIADYRAVGSELHVPHYTALLAEVMAKKGQIEEGLNVLGEALLTAQSTGGQMYEAELYRLKGELLLKRAATEQDNLRSAAEETREQAEASVLREAECCFRQAIEIARTQCAKSLELRAVTSLGRLWQKQGKNEEARAMLRETYSWFTEGFNTQDLKEAKALLDEMQN
jgi:predicted ATPase